MTNRTNRIDKSKIRPEVMDAARKVIEENLGLYKRLAAYDSGTILGVLYAILGADITAVIAGVDVQRIQTWLDGAPVPSEIRDRLAVASEITQMLLSVEAASTVRAWWIGRNTDFHVSFVPEPDGAVTMLVKELKLGASGPTVYDARQRLLEQVRFFVADYLDNINLNLRLPEMADLLPRVLRLSLAVSDTELLEMLLGPDEERASCWSDRKRRRSPGRGARP